MKRREKVNYIFSRFLKVERKNNWVVVFHELHPQPLYFKIKDWSKIEKELNNVNIKIIRKLRLKKLVIRFLVEDEQEFERVAQSLNCRLDYPSILYLILTSNCNLNCGYCPISNNNNKICDGYMDLNTTKSAIDLWIKNIKNKFCSEVDHYIIFYGGEPLLNRKTLVETLYYIDKLKREGKLSKNIKLIIATNGVLIDSETIRFFKRFKVIVSIGCDGPAWLHNFYRFDKSNQGTFSKVEEIIIHLVKSKIPVFVSVSITPKNVDSIKHFSNFFKQYNIQGFGFNFLKGTSLLSLVPKHKLDKYYKSAIKGVIENFLNSGDCYFENQIGKKYTSFFKKQFFPLDCGGYGNQWAVYPDGTIGNCPFFKNRLSHIDKTNFTIDNSVPIKAWRKRLPLYNPVCKTCSAKSICGGGCPWNVKELKNNICAIDEVVCGFTKNIFDNFIWSGLNIK